MGPQSLQHFPHDGVAIVVAQGFFGRHRTGNTDRQNDVAEVLAFELAHYTPDCLNHVNN